MRMMRLSSCRISRKKRYYFIYQLALPFPWEKNHFFVMVLGVILQITTHAINSIMYYCSLSHENAGAGLAGSHHTHIAQIVQKDHLNPNLSLSEEMFQTTTEFLFVFFCSRAVRQPSWLGGRNESLNIAHPRLFNCPSAAQKADAGGRSKCVVYRNSMTTTYLYTRVHII